MRVACENGAAWINVSIMAPLICPHCGTAGIPSGLPAGTVIRCGNCDAELSVPGKDDVHLVPPLNHLFERRAPRLISPLLITGAFLLVVIAAIVGTFIVDEIRKSNAQKGQPDLREPAKKGSLRT
jgi:hypothetical protein